ncbi:bystin protein [Cystoisospora suis]|uniref:Bystin protein n=1 Tax=Cystoisospora suis TaxID=483139 RepID=A0A2C6KIL2_9APIC|nr:bystin protein [Cystoisospora suis]
MPKVKSEKRKLASRHNPLHVDLLTDAGAHPSEISPGKPICTKKSLQVDDGEDFEDDLVPKGLSKKLLRLVDRQQRADLRTSEWVDGSDASSEDSSADLDLVEDGGFGVEDEEVAEDELFMQRQQARQTAAATAAPTLADFVLKKLQEKEAGERDDVDHEDQAGDSLPPKVVEVYTAMAAFLQKYRSGRMPKAFKVLPRLQKWEEILLLTEPQNWSKQAMFGATKIFCSNLSSPMAQRFLCLVLLPAVRDDISTNKKLNYHLYHALKKALFKPSAFFKGIFLPLALDGCSSREAIIVGSVVAKVSIPMLHAAAALMRLAFVPASEWLPAVSVLMAVLINKKYALPSKAIAACVAHFHQFASRHEKLPVSWHKAFLVFAQRYKFCLSEADRSKLKEVLRAHFHEQIGPEIRRELLARDVASLLQEQQRAMHDRAGPSSTEDVDMGRE